MKYSWTDEEKSYLASVYTCPRLYTFWNLEAKQRGWAARTDDAIKGQIRSLRKSGEIGSRRLLDEANGWVSKSTLASSIGVGESVILRWIQSFGLEAHRDGTPNAIIKINLESFAQWAVSPIGCGQLSKALRQNPLGIAWVLRQIGEYTYEDLGIPKIKPEDPVKVKLSAEEAIAYVQKNLPDLDENEAAKFLEIEGLIEKAPSCKVTEGIKLSPSRIYKLLKPCIKTRV